MRRYRKGETFRPPTAAESAAHADTAESHRHAPAQPQDRAPVGQSILVKTPEDGIPARDEDTIYWEKCKRCIERYTADEKEIVETDEEVLVFNLFEQGVAGDEYVPTALTDCGTRYASVVTGKRHFELKDDHAPGTTTTAHPQDWDSDTSDWVTDTDADREFDVTDPLSEYRGRGKDTFSSPHDTGSEGVAEKNSESSEWEIVRMQPNALAIEGTIVTDDTLTAQSCHVMAPTGGIIVDQDPAGNITWTNPHGHPDIDTGMKVFLVWDESIPGWTERQKDCP